MSPLNLNDVGNLLYNVEAFSIMALKLYVYHLLFIIAMIVYQNNSNTSLNETLFEVYNGTFKVIYVIEQKQIYLLFCIHLCIYSNH